ncbi:MAG: hypothetical protein WC356_04385 [Candidatus Micrarchaeia archaeon]|jgi:hypothetical protein
MSEVNKKQRKINEVFRILKLDSEDSRVYFQKIYLESEEIRKDTNLPYVLDVSTTTKVKRND